MAARKPRVEWIDLGDEELLKIRICDLGLRIAGTDLEAQVAALYAELAARGLKLRPQVYLGDEWFSPERMVAIAIPFYLAHPRLIALERKHMLQVEGESPADFIKLLRHEAGHTFDHGYRFSKRPRWREVFGSPDQEYAPENYKPRPYSRSFVRHLDNWYAQAHPDEDFAETFAVWLDPASDWRRTYARWPIALEKLKYLDELADSVRGRAARGLGGYLPCSASKLRTTLGAYYARRKRENAQNYPDFYDADLRRIFERVGDRHNSEPATETAARYMRRNSRAIIESVAAWTGEHKYTISGLVKKLTDRSQALGLRAEASEARLNLEVAAYLATLVSHYLFTGKFKRTV